MAASPLAAAAVQPAAAHAAATASRRQTLLALPLALLIRALVIVGCCLQTR